MVSDKHNTKLIVRRKPARQEEGHVAAWKIAYADFVTAMMAFFLLLWLINSAMSLDLAAVGNSFMDDLDKKPDNLAAGGGLRPTGGTSIDQIIGREENQHVVDRVLVDQEASLNVVLEANQDALRVTDQKFRDQGSVATSLENYTLLDIEQELRRAVHKLHSESPEKKVNMDLYTDDVGFNIEFINEEDHPIFRWRSAEVSPPLKTTLLFVARYLAGLDRPVYVTGFAAKEGDDLFNWRISTERANNVRQVMARMGVTKQRMFGIGGRGSNFLLNPRVPEDPNNIRLKVTLLSREDHLLIGDQTRFANPVSISTR